MHPWMRPSPCQRDKGIFPVPGFGHTLGLFWAQIFLWYPPSQSWFPPSPSWAAPIVCTSSCAIIIVLISRPCSEILLPSKSLSWSNMTEQDCTWGSPYYKIGSIKLYTFQGEVFYLLAHASPVGQPNVTSPVSSTIIWYLHFVVALFRISWCTCTGQALSKRPRNPSGAGRVCHTSFVYSAKDRMFQGKAQTQTQRLCLGFSSRSPLPAPAHWFQSRGELVGEKM